MPACWRSISWFAWAGVAGIAPTSRGEYMHDARKLYALEAFLGDKFLQSAGTNAGTPNPGPNSAALLLTPTNHCAKCCMAN